MLVDLSNLLTEGFLPRLGRLGPETLTGVVFCSFWWQTDPHWKVSDPQNSVDNGWAERPF